MKKNRITKSESRNSRSNYESRAGIVLLVTLVLLVVLSTLGYTLSSRVAVQRHRNHYIIDYQAARYGCDSAVKYAIATLQDINTPRLISRPNEPDFSDLFSLSEAEYEELRRQWAGESRLAGIDKSGNFNDINDVSSDGIGITGLNDPNSLTVRGPYGPPWPLVTKPVEFEIASVTVRIEIEDENAKYPLGWALLSDKDVRREALAGLETFCEWMNIGDEQIDSLKLDLKKISEIKTFKFDFKPIKKRMPIKAKTKSRRRGRRSRTRRSRMTTISVSEQAAKQSADFAKLFHSSLIGTEMLARPTIISESRKESALKYMGMWASRKVNINTAPRHVLEAAFTFGGDADKIAEEIIQRRRIEPFKDVQDLKKAMLRYSDSIEKCRKYIITVSSFFTIKITAVSGVAKASAIIAITKNDKKIERIAVIGDW